MIKLLGVFFVPIIPFSFVVDYVFENCKSCRNYFFPVLVLLGVLVGALGVGKAGTLLILLAVLTSIAYTYRLFRVQNYEEWLLTYYIAVASLSWLHPEKMLFFISAFAIPLTVIHFLILHMKNQGAKPEVEEFKGIATYLPVLGTLAFVALVSSLVIAPAYAFFTLYGVFKGNLILTPILLIEWLVWLWVGFKMFSPVFFEEKAEAPKYEDLDFSEVFPLTFLLFLGLLLPVL
ncbi:hypothetical protein [Aquifex aeolicus]|uniref:Uncharacterized protein aq_836 n=1 Tax=Aquifex aeolicus (strain VF5) TaxID=224324 RepID=Y836_AQUAE|nr:hypothetical protein [Aquifex aeolicus]O67008.1 RecName: Full=Uncharacterized protein aq_836 [Aquifex aeolicus VF5]AAC06970.1 putative protein [Aquifex aeolicus VF5]